MLGTFGCFLALAMATNTLLPFPFEPVLVHFATGRPHPWPALFVLGGSVGAGLAGVVELAVLEKLRGRLPRGLTARRSAFTGGSFYVWTFLMAMLPVPFCVVRIAAIWERPRALGYGLATALGRIPRYALIVGLWELAGLPRGLIFVFLGLALAQMVWVLRKGLTMPVSFHISRFVKTAVRLALVASVFTVPAVVRAEDSPTWSRVMDLDRGVNVVARTRDGSTFRAAVAKATPDRLILFVSARKVSSRERHHLLELAARGQPLPPRSGETISLARPDIYDVRRAPKSKAFRALATAAGGGAGFLAGPFVGYHLDLATTCSYCGTDDPGLGGVVVGLFAGTAGGATLGYYLSGRNSNELLYSAPAPRAAAEAPSLSIPNFSISDLAPGRSPWLLGSTISLEKASWAIEAEGERQ